MPGSTRSRPTSRSSNSSRQSSSRRTQWASTKWSRSKSSRQFWRYSWGIAPKETCCTLAFWTCSICWRLWSQATQHLATIRCLLWTWTTDMARQRLRVATCSLICCTSCTSDCTTMAMWCACLWTAITKMASAGSTGTCTRRWIYIWARWTQSRPLISTEAIARANIGAAT